MKQTRFRHKLLLSFLACALSFTACSDYADDEAGTTLANVEHAPPLIRDAYLRISGNSVRPVDIHRSDSTTISCTRDSRSTKIEDFTIEWCDYRIIRCDGEEFAVIPLTHKQCTAYTELTVHGRTKKSVNKMHSQLIIRRDTLTQRVIPVVGTYIYDKAYAASHKNQLDSLFFSFEGTNFTGYFVSSRLDGIMLCGQRIVNGQAHFYFKPNPTPVNERDSLDYDDDLHIFLNLEYNPTRSMRTVRSATVDPEDYSSLLCSSCGRTPDYCQCAYVVYCCNCKKNILECICDPNLQYCSKCNHKIDKGKCNCCTICKSYPCTCDVGSGSSQGNSGQTGSNSTGGSTGGNSGSSGSSGNSGSSSKPSHMTTPAKLTAVAKTTTSTMTAKYGTSKPVCNLGVQHAFTSIFGSANLPPGMSGRANDMARAWANNPNYWQPISIAEAQTYANNGYFVVAGYINPNSGQSGHVVVIVPGKEEKSSSWGCNVPQTMDTGSNKRSTDKHLNNSFSSDKKNDVYFYYYKNGK